MSMKVRPAALKGLTRSITLHCTTNPIPARSTLAQTFLYFTIIFYCRRVIFAADRPTGFRSMPVNVLSPL